MMLMDLLEYLMYDTYVVLYDMNGEEVERFDGKDSLSGDYDYCEVMNVYTQVLTTHYGSKEPFIVIDIETGKEE